MKKLSNNYYKSCDTLPIFNFYRILNTNDLSWLVKSHQPDDEPLEFDEAETEELNLIWFDITNRYNEMFGEKTGNTRFVVLAQVAEMAREYEIVAMLLKLYSVRKSVALSNALKEWRYFPDDMERSVKKLEGLVFRMKFIKSKHKDLFPDKDEPVEKKQYDLYEDVVLLEDALGNGTHIDVHKCVVTRWVRMIIYSGKKNSEIKRNRKKHGRGN